MKMKIPSSSLYHEKKRNGKTKSQENGLENDIASLEKRLDEDNLSETEKNQILDELAATKRRTVYSQNERRDYTIESPLVQRGGKIRNISQILKNDTLLKIYI